MQLTTATIPHPAKTIFPNILALIGTFPQNIYLLTLPHENKGYNLRLALVAAPMSIIVILQ